MDTPEERDGKRPETPDSVRVALLENPRRREIQDLLKRKPGLNRNQIAHRLGLNVNGVMFHMSRMKEAGLVETRPAVHGREVLCFTPENVHLWDNESTRVLFGRGPLRQVALYLAEYPGGTTKELAEALDISTSTARSHGKILESRGLIQRLRIAHDIQHHAQPTLMDWAEEVAKKCMEGRETG